MKKLLSLISFIVIAGTVSAQEIDAVSGATVNTVPNGQKDDPRMQVKKNNDNFDNQALVPLKITLPVVSGEVSNPGIISLDALAQRSVIVKDVVRNSTGDGLEFNGVFKYAGYPLADLLNDFVVAKKNNEEFPENIDMCIIVSNDLGESAVFSWGEIFFSKRGRDIIFATSVAPVLPLYTDDKWDIPTECCIIAGSDFHTLRNIKNPSRISLCSFPVSFSGKKGTSPLYVPYLEISMDNSSSKISKIPGDIRQLAFNTAFYGLHKGFKEVKQFKGYSLAGVLNDNFRFSDYDLQHGILTVGAIDGFRVAYSLSEILNRCDLEEILLIDLDKDENGRFKIFPSADVFADRQLKGAAKGYIINFD